MFLEYDWTFDVYRPRFYGVFTPVRGYHSFASLEEARTVLGCCRLKLGSKTDSRTWRIEAAS